jgi:UDP-4-amino-4,6-dideoxy-N-acetyl-beta-L-altrosamine N-acetyltransferase
MNDIVFIDVLGVEDTLKERVRQWRNLDDIRKCMLNQHIISEEEHLKWIESLQCSDTQKHWVIFAGDIPIGSVYISDIDQDKSTVEWGFYIAEKAFRGKGYGAAIIRKLLKIVYDDLCIRTLITRVLSSNIAARKLYEKMNFIETGTYAFDESSEVIVLSFSKDEWSRGKGNDGKQEKCL